MIYIVHTDLLEGEKNFRELTDEEVINLCKKDNSGRHIVCEDLKQLERIWNGEDIEDIIYPENAYMRVIDEPQEFFPVSQVSRADLEYKGFDTSKVTDEQMKRIASRMDNIFLDEDYWLALVAAAKYLEIPRYVKDRNGNKLIKGQKVHWYDPHDLDRDPKRIYTICEEPTEDILKITDDFSKAEVRPYELEIVE